ncbi:hypothetical protein [uncultured Gemmiger sp.]|uniref:hypothetical protein n=1 Tax=uncultured Gemmiger sp. TaxID=1623490 RepID=UPI0025ECAC87|nr:hypothetical protein [uncultured Gemmiger sp.]
MVKRGLYGQTVTVYHPVAVKKRVDRFVLHDVFCQLGSREVPDAAGAKRGAAMLLVVPERTRGAANAGGGEAAAGAKADAADQAAGAAAEASGDLREMRYGVDYKLAAGDRVLLGEGGDIAWADWGGFVPAEVDGLGVITYVLPLYLRGGLHHVEAGAWWSAGGAGAGRLAR